MKTTASSKTNNKAGNSAKQANDKSHGSKSEGTGTKTSLSTGSKRTTSAGTKATKSASAKAARPASVKAGSTTNSRSPKTGKGEADVKLVSKSAAQDMITRLCKRYPDADCELDFNSTFQLLTSVILSAQTTDVQVNKCTPNLFKRFPTAKALAEGSLDEIKELIKATGFFNAKATNIQRCAQALVSNFGGEVPKTLEALTTLPGVGRKTANVVLGVAFGVPGWTVDTHVQRLSMRLGLSKNTDPNKIEIDLQKLYPEADWTKYSITLIWHGRRLCYARKPDCAECPINDLCPSSKV